VCAEADGLGDPPFFPSTFCDACPTHRVSPMDQSGPPLKRPLALDCLIDTYSKPPWRFAPAAARSSAGEADAKALLRPPQARHRRRAQLAPCARGHFGRIADPIPQYHGRHGHSTLKSISPGTAGLRHAGPCPRSQPKRSFCPGSRRRVQRGHSEGMSTRLATARPGNR